MFKHEWYQFVILRKALSANSRSDLLGWPMTLGSLGQAIRDAGLDETGREPMDALIQLHGRKLIVLKKTHAHGLGYTTFDYDEYPDKNRFFWGDFGVYVTSEGSAYFNELEANAHAAVQVTAPSRETKIGFHS